METQSSHRWWRRARRGLMAAAAGAFVACVAHASPLGPDDPPLTVVLIQSFQPTLEFSRTFQKGLTETLDASGRPYELYVEALDAARFPEERQQHLAARYLSEKYDGKPVDAVVANSRPAGDLLIATPDLFPAARRIYANGPSAEAAAERPPEGLLIHSRFAFDRSVAEAMRLAAPKALHVIADASSPSARARLRRFREAVDAMGLAIPVDYLVDRPLPELIDRVSALPSDAAVYALGVFRDGEGRRLAPIEVTRRLAAASGAPVFTYWQAAGSGAVGGLVLSAEALGRAAGRALLDGAESGVIEDAGLAHVYDWRALERWGLTDARFPEDAVFLFREPSLWQAHRTTVLAALAVGALLLALCAALLVSAIAQRRRKQALEEGEMRFRAMADNIPQLAWMARSDGFIFWFNRRWFEFTGATLERMRGWGWRAVHHPDHVERVVERLQHSWDMGEPWEDTFPLRGADGAYRWFLSRARPVRDAAGRVQLWFGTNTDITDQLEAEQALRDSEERLISVVEQLSEGLVIFDVRGRSVHWNPAARAIHGIRDGEEPPPDLAGAAALFEVRAAEDDDPLDADEWIVPRILRGETVRNAELLVVSRRDGWEKVLSYSGSLARRAGGETLVVLVIADVTERRRDQERERLLMREVDHRAKNVLAVVMALVKLTKAEDIRAFKAAVDGRVTALARTHSLLAENRWDELRLDAVIGAELSAYPQDRIRVGGPPVLLPPEAVQPLAMVLHELATNAAKYGALSTEEGRLEIVWEIAPEGALRLRWTERGGPPAPEPTRLGFGSRLIRDTVSRQLGGAVRKDWGPDGLVCAISLERGGVWRRDPGGTRRDVRAPEAPVAPPKPAGRRRILIVEDDALIAARIEEDLRDARYEIVGPASTVEAAIRLATTERELHAALVDLNLNGAAAWPVVEALRERGVPFSLATGYAETAAASRAPHVLQKPFSTEQLIETVERILESSQP